MTTEEELNCKDCKWKNSKLYPVCDMVKEDEDGNKYCANFRKKVG